MEALENLLLEEEAAKQINKAIGTDQNAVPYIPMSKLPTLGTVVPLNLAGETLQAQFDFTEKIPDVDQYVVQKLGYTSKYALSQALAAEQVDAVAMAIKQIEEDSAFILADMTGVGKGRICAAILRYAKMNGCLPIFITEKDNLFSAIYRDIVDIGGIETKAGGKMNAGYPLILNGFISGGVEKTYDEKGRRVKVEKPSKTGIVNQDGKEIVTAPLQSDIKLLIQKDFIPKKYDYLMLTYSQLSGSAENSSGKRKTEFILNVIEKLKGKVIIVIDECHNAAGTKSSTGEAVTKLVNAAKGVLFSSATFSKRPDNMYIYALKTDVSKSPLGTNKLIQVIKAGGERLTENLASNLVLSQQMIRREKTYDNCNVEYNYMGDSNKSDLFEKYDNTIKLFRRLMEFFSSGIFTDAARNAIARFAKDNKVDLAPPRPKDKGELEAWQSEYEGSYYSGGFTAGEIKRNQFQFIETLLFALKADFVADQAISQLTTKSENLTVVDKVKFESNRKPVIAVRNTLEGVYYSLGLEVGDFIKKADFSVYVYALAKEAMSGSIVLREVIVEDKKEKKKRKEIRGEQEVLLSDFTDNGKMYQEILAEIEEIHLNIPLSPIDYIINKIESTRRESWDKHGVGEKFTVGEVTGRRFRLNPVLDFVDKEGKEHFKYELQLNKKPKNKSTTFKQFNNGFYDVLLINESGATGEDAHSSSKFADQRPRVMIIHQVELDVSTEVQKRGRINRTGMVNYPTYIYAVSRIPSEIRRLLMLVRKLRSLDANTTANQKQSAKLSSLRDSFNNPIEDVINVYGDECLQEFISSPDNEKYAQYMPNQSQEALGALSNSYAIEIFVRNLELSLSDEQEYFYNTVNALYIRLKDELGDNFDLETSLVDLRAAIKTRLVVSKGDDTSPFNSSVYEEDDYVLSEDKPYKLEKVTDMVLQLSKGGDAGEFYESFLADFQKHFKEEHIQDVINGVHVPDYSFARDEMEKMLMEAEYKLKIKNAVSRAKDEFNEMMNVFFNLEMRGNDDYVLDNEGYVIVKKKDGRDSLVFRPNNPAVIPAVPEDCYELDEDGLPQAPKEWNNAKFVGIRILNTAKEKYSPMNLELIFCQLSGKPKIILKPTAKGREVLSWVKYKTSNIESTRIKLIANWQVDENKRTIMRLFTGNILGAYGVAKDRVARDEHLYSAVVKFLKFTTADESTIRLGIKVSMSKYISLQPSSQPISYQLNSKKMIDDILASKDSLESTNGYENFQVKYDKWDGTFTVIIFGGLRNSGESKVKKYSSKLFNDGELNAMIKRLRNHDFDNLMTYKPVGSSKRQVVKYNSFTVDLKIPEARKYAEEIFGYIYSVYPFNLEIRGLKTDEAIFNKPDLFVPPSDEEGGDESQEQGEYGYDTVKPYESVAETIQTMPKFLRYIKTSRYGTVVLNRKANVKEAISHWLIPLEPTIQDMVSQTFQVITSDSERIKFTQDIEKAIKSGDSDWEVGVIVENALLSKLNTLETIFGHEPDREFIGGVFIKYAKGEVELPSRKKPEEGSREERAKRPLSLDTAEEFMILFSNKVKNQ